MLTIPRDRLAFIIEKAREYDVQVPGEKDASDPADDDERQILLSTPDNPTGEELRGALDTLNQHQKAEIHALVLIGRGDFEAADWKAALKQAQEVVKKNETAYLMGTPLLADYLEEAAAGLGVEL